MIKTEFAHLVLNDYLKVVSSLLYHLTTLHQNMNMIIGVIQNRRVLHLNLQLFHFKQHTSRWKRELKCNARNESIHFELVVG